MYNAITYRHPDGTPYTEEEVREANQREMQREINRRERNATCYTVDKNRERTADALESIADSLESIAADAERIADMLALFGQKGAQNDR